jgi:hypothetical protein
LELGIDGLLNTIVGTRELARQWTLFSPLLVRA